MKKILCAIFAVLLFVSAVPAGADGYWDAQARYKEAVDSGDPEKIISAVKAIEAVYPNPKDQTERNRLMEPLKKAAQAYESLGEYAMMKDALGHIPEIYFTRLELDAEMLRGDERLEPAHKQKRLSADWTIDMLLLLADIYEEKGERDMALSQLRCAKAVIEAFRDDRNVEYFTGTVYDKRKDELPAIEARIAKLEKNA